MRLKKDDMVATPRAGRRGQWGAGRGVEHAVRSLDGEGALHGRAQASAGDGLEERSGVEGSMDREGAREMG
jgi:hypothetical protein